MPDELDVNAGEGPQDAGILALADLTKAWLRTVFPVAWSAVVTLLVARIPALGDFTDWLNNFGAVILLSVVTALVYPLFRLIEKSKAVPDWFVRILLGSAKRPVYVTPAVADAVNDGESVQVTAVKTDGTRVG